MKKISIGSKIGLVIVTFLFIGLVIISIVKFILPSSKVSVIIPKVTAKTSSKSNDSQSTKFVFEKKIKSIEKEVSNFPLKRKVKNLEQKVNNIIKQS